MDIRLHKNDVISLKKMAKNKNKISHLSNKNNKTLLKVSNIDIHNKTSFDKAIKQHNRP